VVLIGANTPLPQRKEGNQKRVLTSDERMIALLEETVTILKKIEYHLMLATDTDLKEL
jgi:hypothetical protein